MYVRLKRKRGFAGKRTYCILNVILLLAVLHRRFSKQEPRFSCKRNLNPQFLDYIWLLSYHLATMIVLGNLIERTLRQRQALEHEIRRIVIQNETHETQKDTQMFTN
jgi:hypothetical protein